MKEEKGSKKKSAKTTKKAVEEKIVIAGVEANPNKKDVVGAIFLLFVGVMLLLNSLEIIDWTIWGYLWKFWPVFLILGGIRMIIGHSKIANWIVSILALIIFGFVGALSFFSYSNREVDEVDVTEISVPVEKYEDVESIDLDIDVGAFDITLMDRDNSERNLTEKYLYTQSYSYSDYGYPELTEILKDGVLSLKFKPSFSNFYNRNFHFGEQNLAYYLYLGQSDIPTDINLELGAGKGLIILSDEEIGTFEANVGAGELDVSFRNEALPSEKLSLEVGAGEINLSLQENVGFELNYDLGLGEVTLDDSSIETFTGSSKSYKSPNYSEADEILVIDANVGVGALNIRYSQND